MERLHRPEEVAEALGVPVATLYQWRYKGIGPTAVKVGRHLRYRDEDVTQFIENLGGESSSDVRR